MDPPQPPTRDTQGDRHLVASEREISGRISFVGEPQFDDRRSGWISVLFLVGGLALFATFARMLVTTYVFILVVAFLGFVFLQWITRGFFTRAVGGMGRTAMLFGRRSPRRELATIPVQPFRVLTGDGAEVQCAIAGSLDGGSLSLGDQVVVSGRFDRRMGIFETSSVRNATTGAVTSPRVPFSDRANRIAMWLLPVAVAWAIFSMVSLWSVFR